MLSLGVCEVGNVKNNFYVELQPISEKFTAQALEVCGLSMEKLKTEGLPPAQAMKNFAYWIKWVAKDRVPKFVGFNLGFDWSFINWYFIKYVGENPFGISGIDTKSVWFGKFKPIWHETSKTHIKRELNLNIPHTHNALDDAIEQAIVFEKVMNYDGTKK